ncbi:amino acid permease [Paractinoplanes brasiliensis]|uniref:Amino acid exporter (AAE family) n=1 Tax=Paractinoplanes brasiliensis TaxID=52695 RepID=A0A4R6JQK8_9ACTN|nr:amino acid permease [Actinoplanes brasiliensis]TDO37661.1 amino acid exporter (AAE family) [Actinoplanes brasiliensis]GID31769.1 amino acid permease [Actinoplanes brasiliensis]
MAQNSGLSLTQGAALCVGAVLGTGVISMPALAADVAGPASLVAWLALIVLSAPLALTFAALGARHPDGGGVSTYVRLAFGPRAGAAIGWTFFFAVPLGAPAATAFAGGYVADVIGGGHVTRLLTFLVIVSAVFAMNWYGVRVSGRVQLVLTGVLAVLLVITVIAALPHADLGNLTPFAPHGWAGVGSAAAVLVWGFAGWEAVSSLAASYRNPRRDVPRATAIAVVLIGVLYLAVALTSVLVLGPALGSSSAPLADLLAAGVGGPVRILTAIVAVLLTVGAVNAYLAGASQLGAALTRDGALPAVTGRTPRRALTTVFLLSLASAALPLSLHTSLLLVTGCFTLVYVIGTAAALRLLPAGPWRVVAAAGFVTVVALLWLNGAPALLSLVIVAASLAYQTWRSRRSARTASPSSISAGSVAPNPSTKPVCAGVDAE